MQNRFLLFLFACAFLAAGTIFSQPAATDPRDAGMQKGWVGVAKVEGEATLTLPGNLVSKLKPNDSIPENGTITTGPKSVVVLAFSNGATTRLGENTEFILQEFRMIPLQVEVKLTDLTAEPTRSRTRLKLNRGELVGDVKPLQINDGTGFVVDTPVGAAGIRGTVFRIVFTPTSSGYAFTLSTISGRVQFRDLPVSSGGTTQGNTGTGPTVTGSGTGTGLAIPTGQTISIDVEVTTNAQGQKVIVIPPTPPASSVIAIPPEVRQQAAVVATEIAAAVQNAVFTPSPPASGSGGGTTGSGTGSGGTTGSTTGSTPGSTTGTGGSGTTGQTGGGQTATVTGTSTTGGNFTATVTTPTTPPPPPPPIPRVTSP
jgi:hypothetical protein